MERDDIIEYSLDSHHSEEAGKKIRKKILFVTALLTIITVVEVFMGVWFKRYDDSWPIIRLLFIALTVLKAAYIVMVFMHLGDERKALKMVILLPYGLFILYLLYIAITESNYVNLWMQQIG